MTKLDEGDSQKLQSKSYEFFWALAFAVACALLWRFTPLHASLSLHTLTGWGEKIRGHPWTPLLVPLIYGVAGLLAFSHALLIWATVFTFPPWIAFLYCEVGSLVSAVAVYSVGRRLRQSLVNRIAGSRWEQISLALGRRGILAIIILHIFPIAPFSILNLVSGASHIRPRDFIIGSILGVTPGIVVVCLLGPQLLGILHHPHLMDILFAILFVAVGWITLRFFRGRLLREMRIPLDPQPTIRP